MTFFDFKVSLVGVIENLDDSYGGPAVSLPTLMLSLEKVGVEVCVVSSGNARTDVNTVVSECNLRWLVHNTIGPIKLRFAPKIKRTLEKIVKENPDSVIYSNNLWNYCALFPMLVSRRRRIPHIIAVRGELFPWCLKQGRLRKLISWWLFQKMALNSAALIHVTSKDELQAVRDLGITSPVALIPHGVTPIGLDVAQKWQELKQRKQEKRKILFMSRLHEKKGIDNLLSAWQNIESKLPDWELDLAGPDYGGYEKKINQLKSSGLLKNVEYLGMLKNKEKFQAFYDASIFILPSYTENFGVVIGEALSAGVPVITTENTPWEDISVHELGVVMRGNSVEEIQKSLLDMTRLDPTELSKKGEKASRFIADNFTWNVSANKMAEVIERVRMNKNMADLEYVYI
ncbi:glycosyltransferase [Aurantivibrio plasticivorans]